LVLRNVKSCESVAARVPTVPVGPDGRDRIKKSLPVTPVAAGN
jgi:hypothetical protein